MGSTGQSTGSAANGGASAKLDAGSHLEKHRIRRLSAADLSQLLAQPPLPAPPGVTGALAEQVLLLLPRLRLLHAQQGLLRRNIEQVLEQLSSDENFPEHRDVVKFSVLFQESGESLPPRCSPKLREFWPNVIIACFALWREWRSRSLAKAARPSWCVCAALVMRLRHVVYHSSAQYARLDPRAPLSARGCSHARAVRGVADRFLALLFAFFG